MRPVTVGTSLAHQQPDDLAKTTWQEEAMSDPRQLERLVQQVQRLPQHDEYWAATSRLARR